ncbi:uncharacterized protein LOC119515333 [Choloepus didactylus]|uniref:uncharacterized protein LOC119515333 n=1 Tax=Choloepus didactylus TaxID=27675 RepID=UPI00189DE456|nr:uncharacterized protein LOC119515333 [Choloepus didactylus]
MLRSVKWCTPPTKGPALCVCRQRDVLVGLSLVGAGSPLPLGFQEASDAQGSARLAKAREGVCGASLGCPTQAPEAWVTLVVAGSSDGWSNGNQTALGREGLIRKEGPRPPPVSLPPSHCGDGTPQAGGRELRNSLATAGGWEPGPATGAARPPGSRSICPVAPGDLELPAPPHPARPPPPAVSQLPLPLKMQVPLNKGHLLQ